LHRVINRETRGDYSAGAVDIETDFFVGIFVIEKQHLRHDDIRDVIVNRVTEKNDAVFQQQRIDIVNTFSAARTFDDHGNDVARIIKLRHTETFLQIFS